MADSTSGRPEVLESISETQAKELEQQFGENDRSAWDTLTTSYGWSPEDSEAAWNWFSIPAESEEEASES